MTQQEIDEALLLAMEADKAEIERLRAEIAAAQAREAALRDALTSVVVRMREVPAVQGDEFADLGAQSRAAIRAPADHSALDALLAQARAEKQEACAKVCDAESDSMEKGALRAIENGEHDEVSAIRSTAWKLHVAANRIRALGDAT